MSDKNGEIIRLEGICKNFPGVQALQNVDFCLKKGEIHALVGENGAGKSTLIKVMTGVERCDDGRYSMTVRRRSYALHSTRRTLASARFTRR